MLKKLTPRVALAALATAAVSAQPAPAEQLSPPAQGGLPSQPAQRAVTAQAVPAQNAIAFSQIGDSVVLRAIRRDLPAQVVEFVANSAKATTFTHETAPDLPSLSARNVIVTLCGALDDRYRYIWLTKNGLPKDFNFDTPLGPDAYKRQFPACFYINKTPARVPLTASNLSELFTERTGRTGSRRDWLQYFGFRKLDTVQLGAKVPALFSTRPSAFKPTIKPEEFVKAVQDRAAGTVNSIPHSESLIAPGKIIVAKAADGSNAARYVPPVDCAALPATNLNLAEIKAAYTLTDGEPNENQVLVSVVDNGFLGATLQNGHLQFKPWFQPRVFSINQDEQGNQTLGIAVDVGDNQERIQPLNNDVAMPLPAKYIPGHGTHVAGLVIGGTGVGPTSGLFDLGKDSWLKLRIIPLSQGQETVSAMAMKTLPSLELQKATIMNLSVAYDKAVGPNLRDMVSGHLQTLFISAAGNDSRDVAEAGVFPAALGGLQNRNALTVAAEDGLGNLTAFTNTNAQMVDLAAPGCNISSSIDGQSPLALSGTSQAAPIVTFAAALLAHRKLTPYRIKRRLLLSGDILSGQRSYDAVKQVQLRSFDDADPVPIVSRSRLNIRKALYYNKDYLRLALPDGVAGQRTELLGTLDASGMLCCGGHDYAAASIFALKRSPAGKLWCFVVRSMSPAIGSADPRFRLRFTVERILSGDDTQVPAVGSMISVPLDALQEFILSDSNMTFVEGE